MRPLAGTGALVRLALRRDRVVLPVWTAVFVMMAAVSAVATVGLYPTETSRVQAAESVNRSQSLVALYGRVYDPTSVGAIAMLKMGAFGAVLVALVAIFIVVRHTRADEESGRAELLGATVVGRHAPLTAALLVAVAANLVLAVFTASGLMIAGLPADGSFAFGLAWAGVGVAFATIAGVAAQVTHSARTATALASATLGFVYLLRAIGDTAPETGPRWLTWLSPIGWGQQFRPYAGNRWWVLLITVGFAMVTAAIAQVLVARRDLGAGLLPDRQGPAVAGPALRSPLALAWRLHRGSLLGWAAGFAVLGLVLGNIASSIGSFFASPDAQALLTKLGGEQGITDAFLAVELGFAGVIASAYGIQAAARLRSEEAGLLAEPVLATATSRIRWAASHLTIAILGTTLLMVVLGIGAGLAHAAQTGDASQVGRVLTGALVQVPAAWVLTGLVLAAFGLAPRLVAAGWAALVGFLLLGELGPLLELDQWVMDISPFAHTPRAPGADVTATPLVALTAVAALLITLGLAGLRRRDIG
jgi:ABC-2 type transport system permease protein